MIVALYTDRGRSLSRYNAHNCWSAEAGNEGRYYGRAIMSGRVGRTGRRSKDIHRVEIHSPISLGLGCKRISESFGGAG